MKIYQRLYLRVFWSALFVISDYSAVFSQESIFEKYTQEISGTDLKIEMVPIPEGVFKMGSHDGSGKANADEKPAHEVKVDAFYMSKFEITWELYMLFINRTIDEVRADAKGIEVVKEVDAIAGATIPYVDMSLGMGTGEGLPVGNVSQLAASRFCEWLSAKTGDFYRLPTEAEWEYAARGGTETAFSFGDQEADLGEHAWFYENSDGSYHKVGQKKPNPWGLYDMHGNVAEWTLDQYLPEVYQKRDKLTENPLEITTKEFPVSVRGGSYYDDAKDLRSAARIASTENWKMRDPQFPKSKWWNTDSPFVGFRIVRPKNSPDETEYKKYWQIQE